MNATLRIGVEVATAAVLIGGSQLTPSTVHADVEQHNVHYLVRIDGAAPNAVVTFMLHDNQTASANLDSWTNQWEADTVMADPAEAGLQVRLQWPSATNVHCQIEVDDNVAVKSDQFINTWRDGADPRNGLMRCGAPLNGIA